jgi:hypothetical protein
VVTLACDLDVFASSIPTSLAAIFLARGYFTKTRDMRALCLFLICHLVSSTSALNSLSRSGNLYCVTIPCIRLSKLGNSLSASFSLRFAPRQGEKVSKARHAVGVKTRKKQFGSISETRTHRRNSWNQLGNAAFSSGSVVWHLACLAMDDGGHSHETCTTDRNVHSTLTDRARDIIRAAGPNRL